MKATNGITAAPNIETQIRILRPRVAMIAITEATKSAIEYVSSGTTKNIPRSRKSGNDSGIRHTATRNAAGMISICARQNALGETPSIDGPNTASTIDTPNSSMPLAKAIGSTIT